MKSSEDLLEVVVFNMGGAIIDSKEQVEAFWIDKMEKYGIDIPEGDELQLRFHGRPARQAVNDLFGELSKDTRQEILQEMASYDASAGNFTMVPGVAQFIKKCGGAGLRMGLVTSALPEKADRMLEGLNYPSSFKARVTANDVKKGKPDPECYLLIANKLETAPRNMVIFEDSISGVKAATGSGATVIGVNEEHPAPSLKEAGAEEIIPDFVESDLKTQNGEVHLFPSGKKRESYYAVTPV